jgi:isochorismate hydrolase
MDDLIKNADILNRATEILDIPLLITEQSPSKLGKTMPEIYFPEKAQYFEKTMFSVFDEKITKFINNTGKTTLVIYGIEAHICVTQSCLDALENEYDVLLVFDAISSRKEYNKEIAVKRLADYGVNIVTTEMLLFELLRDANHPKFREVSRLVK